MDGWMGGWIDGLHLEPIVGIICLDWSKKTRVISYNFKVIISACFFFLVKICM